MHRFTGHPCPVDATRDIDVANLFGRSIAIRHDRSTRRHRRGVLATVARTIVETQFCTELSVGRDGRRDQHHLVRGVMTSLRELAAVEPDGAECSALMPHRDEAMLAVR